MSRQPIYGGREWTLKPGPKQGLHLSRRLRDCASQLRESLGAGARGKMIDLVHGFWFLMQRDDGFRNVVHGNDIGAVGRAERQDGKPGEENERANHFELRRLRAAAVAQHNAGTKDSALHVREQFAHHVLAEFFCSRVRIVVRAIPVDRSILADNFVAAMSGYGDSRHLAESPQTMRIVRAASKLRDFQCSPEIYVEAAFLGLAVERCGAVDD